MCDSIVALPGETAAGLTLYGKNSDRKGDEAQPLVQHPAAYHPPGSTVACTHVEIPQVEETCRVIGHSPWWVWGFEHGVNEHGVAVGNHTVFSREPIEEEPGLIGMDLVRLALERGRSARAALEVVAGLVERHGQGGAALAPEGAGYHNSFVLADASQAWLLETSNRRWAARPLRLAAASNHLSIGKDWERASTDLEPFARAEGFWDGPDRIDFARAYRNPHVPPHISSGRQCRAQELLGESRGRHSVESFRAILGDHAEGGSVWSAADASPGEERFFTLCAHSEPVHWTTASLVAPLPADRSAPWPVYVSFGTPCCGVFLPVYLAGTLPAALARGGPEPEADSAWWAFKRLQDAVSLDPVVRTPAVRAGWAELEAAIEAERASVESEAVAMTRAGNAHDAAEVVSSFMNRTTDRALRRAQELRAGLG